MALLKIWYIERNIAFEKIALIRDYVKGAIDVINIGL